MSDENNTENDATFGTSELSRNGMTFTVGQTGATAPAAGDPWASAQIDCPVGTRLKGRVVNFKPYGFFVETDRGFFGLVHGSQIPGWDWHHRFDAVFHLGDEVEVEVMKIDAAAHRMAFSCVNAPVLPDPEEEIEEDEEDEEIELPPQNLSEVAARWVEENPERSAEACAWLRAELEDGPLYGPMTSLLSGRFGVPVPVSFWIRRFPEFVCYLGRNDSPNGLPAVALAGRAEDRAYWRRFKTSAEELASAHSPEAEEKSRAVALAQRMKELDTFPGAEWISSYVFTAKGLEDSKVLGAGDTIERLVVPLLGQLGWDVSTERIDPPVLVRGEHGAFDLRLFDAENRLDLAVVCEKAATTFHSLRDKVPNSNVLANRNVVERVLGICNGERGFVEKSTRVVWTNGLDWFVFKPNTLALRIGILSDRQGASILDATADLEAENDYFSYFRLPVAGPFFDWLGAFANLRAAIGPRG